MAFVLTIGMFVFSDYILYRLSGGWKVGYNFPDQ